MDKKGFLFLDLLVWLVLGSTILLTVMACINDLGAAVYESFKRAKEYTEFVSLDMSLREDVARGGKLAGYNTSSFTLGDSTYSFSDGKIVRVSGEQRVEFKENNYAFMVEDAGDGACLKITVTNSSGEQQVSYNVPY